jgi:hypothetical protein
MATCASSTKNTGNIRFIGLVLVYEVPVFAKGQWPKLTAQYHPKIQKRLQLKKPFK